MLMYSPSEANKKWRRQGKLLRDEIIEWITSHPDQNSYQIAKQFDVDPSTIKHHIKKIMDETDTLNYRIQIIDNTSQIAYSINNNVFKIYIEEFDILSWKKDLCYLYLTSMDQLTLDIDTHDGLDKICLMRLIIPIKMDNQGKYFILPENLVHFFKLNTPNYKITLDQTIAFLNEKDNGVGTLIIRFDKELI
jgi:Transposase